MIHHWFQYWFGDPSRSRSIADYARLARHYDESVSRIEPIRRDAVDALSLKPGETVLDVACGTGDTLLMLADRVAPGGCVIGVEQSDAMAALAMRKINGHREDVVIRVVVCPIEAFDSEVRADAVLLTFTQDVLQNPAAIDTLGAVTGPHARFAVAGLRFLPWWWGAAINVFNGWRARRYLTTLSGMREPWRPLRRLVPDLAVRRTYLLGSCYLACGRRGRRTE